MREIDVKEVTTAVKKAAMDANYELGEDMLHAFEHGLVHEESPAGQAVFRLLLENAGIAKAERIPICQDTGLAIVFIELGQEVHLTGGSLTEAINKGISQATQDGFLRPSTCHPFTSKNTGDIPRRSPMLQWCRATSSSSWSSPKVAVAKI